jgi:hypothetical protein
VAQRREDLRAADKDREFVAEQLRTALSEGRLDLTEYDERLAKTYAARTYGDLDGILDDLPGTVPPGASQVVPAQAPDRPVAPHQRNPRAFPQWLGAIWGGWFTVGLICTVIWAATGAHYFWPVWVIGPWGAVLVARTLGGLVSGVDPREAERHRREAERERRRIRRYGEQDDPE